MKVNLWVILIVVLLFAAGIFAWNRFRSGDTGMSDSTAVLADSLDATRSAHIDTVSVLAKAETVYVTRATVTASSASAARRASEEIRRLADSLAATAETAEEWRVAHDTRKLEADSLRDAADKWQKSYVDSDSAYRAASLRAETERVRRESGERLISGLRLDLAAATKSRWTDRISVTLGYGATAARSGEVVHGPSLTAGYRVWPSR